MTPVRRSCDQQGFVLLSLVLGLGLLGMGALRFVSPPGAEVGTSVAEELRELERTLLNDAQSPAEARARLRLAEARESLR